MRRLAVTVVLLSLLFSSQVFGQSTNATVSGTVSDATAALVPGVTVTATNNDTGVVTTVITNEAGAYNFASLLPGVYKVSAALPGFQTKTFTDVQLGNAERLRLNFTLSVSNARHGSRRLRGCGHAAGDIEFIGWRSTFPEPTRIAAQRRQRRHGFLSPDSGCHHSGQRRSWKLCRLGRFRNNQHPARRCRRGRRSAMDGKRSDGNAHEPGPDRRTEGRRSAGRCRTGPRQCAASVPDTIRNQSISRKRLWNVRNSAFDANTWNNNNDLDPVTGQWSPTAPDWHNVHNIVGSYGGPIVRNKTFFFAPLRSGPRQHPYNSESDRADAVRAEWNLSVLRWLEQRKRPAGADSAWNRDTDHCSGRWSW